MSTTTGPIHINPTVNALPEWQLSTGIEMYLLSLGCTYNDLTTLRRLVQRCIDSRTNPPLSISEKARAKIYCRPCARFLNARRPGIQLFGMAPLSSGLNREQRRAQFIIYELPLHGRAKLFDPWHRLYTVKDVDLTHNRR